MAGDTQEPRGLGWGYIIYQQIAGVIGAFALIAFLGHFIDFDWRGALRELVDMWDLYVRPAVKVLLDVTVVTFVKWVLNWEIELPLVVRDYVAVGLALSIAVTRGALQSGEVHRNDLGNRNMWFFVFVPILLSPIAWPLVMVFFVLLGLILLDGNEPDGGRRVAIGVFVLPLVPVIYLLLLLAANYVLLSPNA